MAKDKKLPGQRADDFDVIDFENFALACSTLSHKSIKRGICKYENTTEGLELFRARTISYFDFVKKANRGGEKSFCADIESWATCVGITRQTLANYRERGGEWQAFIDYTKDVILGMKKEFMLCGKIAPVTAIFDLVNNHGYRNASSFDRERTLTGTGAKNLTFDDLKKIANRIKGEEKTDAETD